MKKTISEIMVILLLASMLTLAFNIQPVKGKPIDRVKSIVLEFDFTSPLVTEDSVYNSVTMPGLPQYGAPGEPVLPFKIVKVLIPQGNDVLGVEVTAGKRKVLEDRFNVDYGKTPIPISSNTTVADQPNQKIYSSSNPFPSVLFSQISEQHLRGYKILMLKLHPVQYAPKTGRVSYFETMTVTISVKETGTTSTLFRNLPQDRALVLDTVDNPNEVNTYTETVKRMRSTSLVNPSDSYDYVIITNNALSSSFQPLVDWKIQKGLSATIVLVEDIMSDPDYHCDGLFGDGCGTTKFNDTQAHIRNFIKDAYINWGTEYVLLGGDDEIIPTRGVYAYEGDDTDYDIPCDMFYGALDGSWDKDNDTIFGEGVYHYIGPENGTAGEEADFFAEVYIGRATVNTAEEATNFVSKTLAYEQNPNASYLKKALMIGETADPWTEGGNGKDLVTDITPQYTTTRLYSRDGTFNRAAVINEMNTGTHIVNHVGHANYWTVMGLSCLDVDNLTNTEYFIAYSVGCYSAAFDDATSGSDEAIAEHFISGPHGAFAYIGNSRYGWYIRGSTDGPGDRYDRSFFDVLSSGIRNIGKALQLSKENLFDKYVHRWTYFTLNLLGDPEAEIVTDITAPTAHFETRTDLLAPPRFREAVSLRGTAERGTATGATFSNFTIEFGLGINPTFWSSTGVSLTDNGESEVVNGTLAIWNTSLVDDGTYTLRLTVSDVDGNVGEDWAVIVVHNILTVHNIDTGLDYGTIQEAINAPETSDGHTILVEEGIYYEHVFVNKSLSLVGENKYNTIIDGQLRGIVFHVMANDVSISRFTILNYARYYPAIFVDHSNGSNMSHNIIYNPPGSYGFYLYWSNNNTITSNTILGALIGGYGIYLYGSGNNIIAGSTVSHNIYGILLSCSNNNILVGNSASNNGVGVILDQSSNNTLSGNMINSNVRNFGVWGYEFSHFMNLIDVSNLVNGEPVYYLVNQKDLVMNPVTHPQVGYLALINCANVTVKGLTLTGNEQGLLLAYTNNSRITNNSMTNNHYGLWLGWSSSNTIFGNNITNNLEGIGLSESSNNSFYHNNFVDNSEQVYSYDSTNIWDDGYLSGGNYWSDHVCTGNPSDGLQPYIIDESNIDHYPFQDPNGWVLPKIPGDVNKDGIVNIVDAVIAAIAFGSEPVDDPETSWDEAKNWDERADLNGDNVVNIVDMTIIGINFGKRLPL